MVRVYPVIPGKLFVSARTATMTPQEKVDTIERNGIIAVINLWHTPDDDIRKICKAYSHHPLADGRNINDNLVKAAVKQVLSHLRLRQTVLVHCYGGRNRSGLVCCLAMIEYLQISGSKAIELFTAARPNSLVNQHFRNYLVKIR